MEFSEPQWRELKDHATASRLLFLSTPFSFEAVALLERPESFSHSCQA